MSVGYDEISLYNDDEQDDMNMDYVDLYENESDDSDDGQIQTKLSLINEESSASMPDVPEIPIPNQVQ